MSLLIPSFKTGFARSAAESEYPGLWKGLRGSWCPFLGPTGLTLYDWSGYGNHGGIVNIAAVNAWTATRKGWAVVYDGSDSYTDIDAAVLASAVGEFSVHLLCHANTSALDDILITGNKAGGNAGDWQVNEFSGNNIRFFYDNATSLDTTGNEFTTGTWHSIVCRLSPAGASIWFAGQQVKSNGVAGVVGGNGQNVRVGRQTNDSGEFDGRVAAAAMWDRALAPSEIQLQHAIPGAQHQLRRRVYATAVALGGTILPQMIQQGLYAGAS